MIPPFHLAIPVHDLNEARAFYGELLGCEEGRSDTRWVDFDFFGHQLVCHQVETAVSVCGENQVDGHAVPVPHFGVVLDMDSWSVLAGRLEEAGVNFVIAPTIRFRGQKGEQATLFFLDPSGNALEFKAFVDSTRQMFER
jgi:extradiol dioxygenase family protein